MNASQLFDDAKLLEAIDAQLKEVKSDPLDQGKRLFLFELLVFAGEWERARKQIEAVRYENPGQDSMVQSYRKLLDAEESRRLLFKNGQPPKFFAPPAEHVLMRLEAINRLHAGLPEEAATLVEQACSAMPSIAGSLNDKPFQSLHDEDDVFGPVLEVMVHGDYYWLPLEQVATLVMNAPSAPRDMIWVQARLEMRNGPAGEVFLPALYPGSAEHPDNEIKLGYRTDWQTRENGPLQAVGGRSFLVDDEPIGLLQWRTLNMST